MTGWRQDIVLVPERPKPTLEEARRRLTADVPVRYLSSDDVEDLLAVLDAAAEEA